MKIIGHRGAKGLALENTGASLKAGMKNSTYALEFDLVKTKDNKLVLHHDLSLKRIYGLDVKISEQNLKELKGLTKNHDNPIISLDEALQIIGNYKFLPELKAEGTFSIFIKEYENRENINAIALTSFKLSEILNYRNNGGKLPVFLASTKISWLWILFVAKRHQLDGITPSWLIIFSPLHMIILRRFRLKTVFYTINNKTAAKLSKKLDPNALICTDYPNKFT